MNYARLLLPTVLLMASACADPPDPVREAYFARQSASAILNKEGWRVDEVVCDGTTPDSKKMYGCHVWAQPPGDPVPGKGLDTFNFKMRCTANDGGTNTCEVEFPKYEVPKK